MPEPATSIPLILATLASLAALVLIVRRLRMPEDQRPPMWPINALLGGIGLLCVAVFATRVVVAHDNQWQPVQAHVDGLLLIASLLAAAVLYIQTRPKLFGFAIFVTPLLALILGWAVCASLWTYRPFKMDTFEPAVLVFHLATIYLGLLCHMIAAAAGAMYLFVQGRLKAKTDLVNVRPMASLETLESVIIRAATLGFALLTIAIVSGTVIATTDESSSLGASWWTSPKVWLATAAWLIYALLINVKYASAFRGRRAAWLAITGLVLVLVTYGVVETLDAGQVHADAPQAEEAD